MLGAGLSSVCISSRAMLSSSCNETTQVINEYILCQVVGDPPHSLCYGASFEVIKGNLAFPFLILHVIVLKSPGLPNRNSEKILRFRKPTRPGGVVPEKSSLGAREIPRVSKVQWGRGWVIAELSKNKSVYSSINLFSVEYHESRKCNGAE